MVGYHEVVKGEHMSHAPDKSPDEEYWRERLTPEQFHVAREKGTEAPFTGAYLDNHMDGMYRCVACGHELFSSEAKFDSGSGWPSFTDPFVSQNVMLTSDDSFGMQRTEVSCAHCGSHLGHLFDDGPADKGGLRYCINSLCLDFQPKTAAHES
jgi:peptide-methionine (R)-S-oxide reductase